MRWTAVIVVPCFLLVAPRALATAQYPDRIFFEGKEYDLLANPMEPFFKKYPDKRPRVTHPSTALWRGYVATFELADKRLMLKDIKVAAESDGEGEPWKSVRGELLPQGQAMAIDWFDGILIIPNGELLRRRPMGYESRYSGYILLEVRQGKLTGERKLDEKGYAQFQEKQFTAFQKMEGYKEVFARWSKSGESKESIDEMIRERIVHFTDRFLVDDEQPSGGKPAQK